MQVKHRTPATSGALVAKVRDGRRCHEGECAPADTPTTGQTQELKDAREAIVYIFESYNVK